MHVFKGFGFKFVVFIGMNILIMNFECGMSVCDILSELESLDENNKLT